MLKMAEEIIRFGAGGVPYRPTTPPAPEPEVEVEETPVVSVTVTESEALGDIPTGKKKK
jgi:hypothetical protein